MLDFPFFNVQVLDKVNITKKCPVGTGRPQSYDFSDFFIHRLIRPSAKKIQSDVSDHEKKIMKNICFRGCYVQLDVQSYFLGVLTSDCM